MAWHPVPVPAPRIQHRGHSLGLGAEEGSVAGLVSCRTLTLGWRLTCLIPEQMELGGRSGGGGGEGGVREQDQAEAGFGLWCGVGEAPRQIDGDL